MNFILKTIVHMSQQSEATSTTTWPSGPLTAEALVHCTTCTTNSYATAVHFDMWCPIFRMSHIEE